MTRPKHPALPLAPKSLRDATGCPLGAAAGGGQPYEQDAQKGLTMSHSSNAPARENTNKSTMTGCRNDLVHQGASAASVVAILSRPEHPCRASVWE